MSWNPLCRLTEVCPATASRALGLEPCSTTAQTVPVTLHVLPRFPNHSYRYICINTILSERETKVPAQIYLYRLRAIEWNTRESLPPSGAVLLVLKPLCFHSESWDKRGAGLGAAGTLLFLGPRLPPEFQASLDSLGLENLVNWPNPQQILFPSQAELG